MSKLKGYNKNRNMVEVFLFKSDQKEMANLLDLQFEPEIRQYL